MAARAELAPTPATSDDGTECLRKQSIVEAAYALLDEEGLEGLTIRAMLKRTGLARRAFYERFAGKDDLVLDELRRQRQSELLGQYNRSLPFADAEPGP